MRRPHAMQSALILKQVPTGTRSLVLALALAVGSMPAAPDSASSNEGLRIFTDSEQGHCVLCHRHERAAVPFQGNLGPDLTNVAARLSPSQLRARIVDPTRFNQDTAMPSYGRTEGLRQVARAYRGQPVLTDAQIDALVQFLSEPAPRQGEDRLR